MPSWRARNEPAPCIPCICIRRVQIRLRSRGPPHPPLCIENSAVSVLALLLGGGGPPCARVDVCVYVHVHMRVQSQTSQQLLVKVALNYEGFIWFGFGLKTSCQNDLGTEPVLKPIFIISFVFLRSVEAPMGGFKGHGAPGYGSLLLRCRPQTRYVSLSST